LGTGPVEREFLAEQEFVRVCAERLTELADAQLDRHRTVIQANPEAASAREVSERLVCAGHVEHSAAAA
jgi:hypothetical protein